MEHPAPPGSLLNLPRDEDGVLHIVALSGGKDSTAMALRLAEVEPQSFVYVCTPTGNELPEMFQHWQTLSKLLGATIWPIMGGTLESVCLDQKMIPNYRARFCTRLLKIAPYKAWLLTQSPAVSYVGLRADEESRSGIDYGGDIKALAPNSVKQRFPLQEWSWGISEVFQYLEARGVHIPQRTDCAACFYQTIGEWWTLWHEHLDQFKWAEEMESKIGHTWRSRKITDGQPIYASKGRFSYEASHRDSWPAWLKDMRQLFEAGYRPRGAGQMDLLRAATCRVCTL